MIVRLDRSVRHRAATVAALLACLLVGPSSAVDLEMDLSTHYIEIRTTFRGSQLTVFGALTDTADDESAAGPRKLDVVVVVRGPTETLAIRRKEELGPIWINRTSFTAQNVPSFYYIASTRPVDEIADAAPLERYHIGLEHLGIEFAPGPEQPSLETEEVAPAHGASMDDRLTIKEGREAGLMGAMPISAPAMPGTGEREEFQDGLIRLLKARGAFSNSGTITFVRPHLFRAEVQIPSTVSEGNYGAEVYVVRNREVVDAEYTVFFIDKKGFEGKIYGLALKNPFVYGLLGVTIAVAAGWISDLARRRR